jgi:hypothetical protein
MGDIVGERDGGLQDAIAEAVRRVRQRQQLLPYLTAFVKLKIAHGADPVGLRALLDDARRHDGMPTLVPVEIAQDRPDGLNGRLDDDTATDFNHASARNLSL